MWLIIGLVKNTQQKAPPYPVTINPNEPPPPYEAYANASAPPSDPSAPPPPAANQGGLYPSLH